MHVLDWDRGWRAGWLACGWLWKSTREICRCPENELTRSLVYYWCTSIRFFRISFRTIKIQALLSFPSVYHCPRWLRQNILFRKSLNWRKAGSSLKDIQIHQLWPVLTSTLELPELTWQLCLGSTFFLPYLMYLLCTKWPFAGPWLVLGQNRNSFKPRVCFSGCVVC